MQDFDKNTHPKKVLTRPATDEYATRDVLSVIKCIKIILTSQTQLNKINLNLHLTPRPKPFSARQAFRPRA
jgi:hypothetical protein